MCTTQVILSRCFFFILRHSLVETVCLSKVGFMSLLIRMNPLLLGAAKCWTNDHYSRIHVQAQITVLNTKTILKSDTQDMHVCRCCFGSYSRMHTRIYVCTHRLLFALQTQIHFWYIPVSIPQSGPLRACSLLFAFTESVHEPRCEKK